MNTSKVVIFLSCLFATTLTAPPVTAAAHGGGHPGMGMAGRPGMGMPGRPLGMGMPRHPGTGMQSNLHGGDLHHRFDHFDNDHDNDHFHNNHFNNVIFIGSFGFPWWWGWGWDPWWWGWGYPYGYYGYGGPYGYGYGYGYGQYGDASHPRVVELQRRLARAGYYHGSIDGVLGPQTRRAIRAYERAHGYAKLEPREMTDA